MYFCGKGKEIKKKKSCSCEIKKSESRKPLKNGAKKTRRVKNREQIMESQ